jgi:hypothetical protein
MYIQIQFNVSSDEKGRKIKRKELIISSAHLQINISVNTREIIMYMRDEDSTAHL